MTPTPTKADLEQLLEGANRELVRTNGELVQLRSRERRNGNLAALALVYVVCAAFMLFVAFDRRTR